MSLSRFLREQRDTLSPYFFASISPLTKIARLIIPHTAVEHGRQGWQHFFHGLSLWEAPLIKKVMALSIQSNIIEYLIPIILYRRAISALTEYYASDSMDMVITAADYVLISTLVTRLYARRLLDNTFYLVSLPRAISSDVEEHLGDLASLVIEDAVTEIYSVFLRFDVSREMLQEGIHKEFNHIFREFLADKKLEAASFSELIPSLQTIFSALPEKYFNSVFLEDFKKSGIANNMASLIANEFACLFSNTYRTKLDTDISEIKKAFLELLRHNQNTDAVDTFIQKMEIGYQTFKPFLPIAPSPPCGCGIKKIVHAGVSSPVYYAANHLITNIPKWLYSYEWIYPRTYYVTNTLMILPAILIYGQCLNECRIALESHCTRHRYEEFARNKAYSFGVGLAFYLTWHTLIQAVYLTTDVNNYFTQDALCNLVMQFGMISILAFNEPLPGKKLHPWDLFSLSRSATLGLITWAQSKLPNMAEEKSRNSMLSQIYSLVSSQEFRYGVDIVLGGGNYIPTIKHDGAEDPRKVLFNSDSFKLFYQFYNKDIELAIIGMKKAHKCATFIPNFILRLPVPPFLSFFVDILQLMKDDCFTDMMIKNKFSELLAFYHFAFNHKEVEKDEVVVTSDPDRIEEYDETKAVISLTAIIPTADTAPTSPRLLRILSPSKLKFTYFSHVDSNASDEQYSLLLSAGEEDIQTASSDNNYFKNSPRATKINQANVSQNPASLFGVNLVSLAARKVTNLAQQQFNNLFYPPGNQTKQKAKFN